MKWKDIYMHLKEKGYDVYALGQHGGDCVSPYLVLRDNGIARKQSIEVPEYEILLYYPISRYSEFSDYINRVKQDMNALYPALRLVEDEAPHYPDDEKKAYMTSLVYRNSRVSKINRI